MKENKIEDKCYVVYKHTAPNGKSYIGITCQNPPEKRWRSGYGYRDNQYFSRAISKYGWSNFLHEVLIEGLTQKEAEEKERELIAHYNSANRDFGYNLDLGGNGAGRLSEETKRKISEGHIGVNAVPVIKYSRIGEFIERYNGVIEAANKNDLCHTAISACCRNIAKTAGDCIWRYENEPLTKEHIDWCNSDERNERKMPIKQYSMSGNFIKEYESAEYASRISGFDAPSIRQCCKYNRRSSHGFIWQYANVELTEEIIEWCNDGVHRDVVPVTQYTISGKFVENFESMADASQKTNIALNLISACCNNVGKTAGGYIWRRSDEYLTDEYLQWCNTRKEYEKKEMIKVCQYSKDGDFIFKWDSADEAGLAIGVNGRTIRACCRDNYKTVGGFIWRYEFQELTKEHIIWCNEWKNPKLHKAVDQYSKDGKFIATYESRTEAELKTGVDKSAIGRCCEDKQRTSMGYIWRHHGVELTKEHLEWCNSTGKEGMRVAIIQYSLDGIFIKKFDSTTAIKKELGFDNSAIIRVCKGEQAQSYGFIWRYASDIKDTTAPLFPTVSTHTSSLSEAV